MKGGELEHLWQNLRYFLEFGWMGCEGKRAIGLSTIPIPLESGRS